MALFINVLYDLLTDAKQQGQAVDNVADGGTAGWFLNIFLNILICNCSYCLTI